MRLLPLLGLLLLACDPHRGGPEDDTDPVPPDDDTDSVPPDDDTGPGVPDDEDCDDGIDNDGDGLVDCEDGDCAEACSEAASCDDAADNDGDGWTDCQDEDCWGVCPWSPSARVQGGRLHMTRWYSNAFWSVQSGVGTRFYGWSLRHQRADILSAWGTLVARTARSDAARVRAECTWHVSGGYAEGFYAVGDSVPDGSLHSSQAPVVLAPGCEAYADRVFRPDELWPTGWRVDAEAWMMHSGRVVAAVHSWYVGSPDVGWRTTSTSVRESTFPSYASGIGTLHFRRRTYSATADVVLHSGNDYAIFPWR